MVEKLHNVDYMSLLTSVLTVTLLVNSYCSLQTSPCFSIMVELKGLLPWSFADYLLLSVCKMLNKNVKNTTTAVLLLSINGS